jgi:uncharacterized repeat protein (TIGR03843 family)
MPASNEYNFDSLITVLTHGTLHSHGGMLPWGSNSSYLVSVVHENHEIHAIYKPQKGEQPLWDFPDGTLCQRETAAYVVSEALGWHLVPPTVLREDSQGMGMLQAFIQHDPSQHYFTFSVDQKLQLRSMVLFDFLINNADRKAGHCLVDTNGSIWGIDHGVCFHTESKLRTVIWDFAGQDIPDQYLRSIQEFLEKLDTEPWSKGLAILLSRPEIAAVRLRTQELLSIGKFPVPGASRPYPWPPV